MKEKAKILIVDDKEANLVVLERILEDVNFDIEIVKSTSGNDAVFKAIENDFALILIDVQMPDMDGFETVKYIRKKEKNKDVPIIFLSAIYKEDFHKIKGINLGAIDFLTKPIVDEILIGKTNIFLDLYESKRKMNEYVKIIEKLAYTDQLTEIYNRRAFFERGKEQIEYQKRKKAIFSIVIIDLDHFKKINDNYGHIAGDLILYTTANEMKKGLRPYDIIGRYGGEEFSILLVDTSKDKANEIMLRIKDLVSEISLNYNNNILKIQFSAGVSDSSEVIDYEKIELEDMIKIADDRLYKAKLLGRNRIIFD